MTKHWIVRLLPGYHMHFLHDVHQHSVNVVLEVRRLGVEAPDHRSHRIVGGEPEMDAGDDQRRHGRKDPEPRVPHARERGGTLRRRARVTQK